jgi:hypothetical protein
MPDDIQRDGVLWEPDRTEILLANALVRQRLLDQEVHLAELADQKAWLQTQRMAAVALELDETDRRIKLQEEIEGNEKWWADVNAREKEANAKLMGQFQKQLDGGKYEAMVERANKAKADMDRDNARLERLALLQKGVLRGTRKQFAAGRIGVLGPTCPVSAFGLELRENHKIR